MIFQLKPPNEQYEYNLPLCCIVIRLDASTIHFQKPVWNKWDAKSPAKIFYLFIYLPTFLLIFQSVLWEEKLWQSQRDTFRSSRLWPVSPCFFMTFTTIYIEIDPTRIYCYNIRNLVQNFF